MTVWLSILSFFLSVPYLVATQLELPYNPQGFVEPTFVLFFSIGVALLFAFKNLCAYAGKGDSLVVSALLFSGAIYSLGALSSALADNRGNFYSFLVLGVLLVLFAQYAKVTKN